LVPHWLNGKPSKSASFDERDQFSHSISVSHPDKFIRNSTLVRKGSSGPVPSKAGQAFASISVGAFTNVELGRAKLCYGGVGHSAGLLWWAL
jgi:hypothetical protein